jgi:diaminohydroxyphosphoribosylaminopyrimidine deaminase / 5-amino-6-(5-phosphoribosylamino)uracil reductase
LVPKQDRDNLKFFTLEKEKDVIPSVLEYLYGINIQSLIVEGGKLLLDEFLSQNTWDEARVFTGNKTFGEGIPAPVIPSEPLNQLEFSESILKIYKNPDSH